MREPFRIGFTGTQDGMTDKQKAAFRKYLQAAKKKFPVVEFHHGDCIGADADAHTIAVEELGVDAIWIHPPRYAAKRAFCKSPHILPEDDYLDRNRTIVSVTNALIATPKEMIEKFRGSGTWMTIREARDRQKKPHKILEP